MGISLKDLFDLNETLEEKIKLLDVERAAREKEWEEVCKLAIELNKKHGITLTCRGIKLSDGKVTTDTLAYNRIIPTEELLNEFKEALQNSMNNFIAKLK